MDLHTLDSPVKPHLNGLTSVAAAEKLAVLGPNRLPEPKAPGPLKIFFTQFRSPFIYVLLAAAVVSVGLGHSINAVFIFLVLLLNAVIGTVQEYSAQRAAAALKNMVPHTALVVRDGAEQKIPADQLVPDDLVMIASGDRIPADIRLISAHGLQVDESMLTGESLPVLKSGNNAGDGELLATERKNVGYAGSTVNRGRGTGVVMATGTQTEIGQIAGSLSETPEAKPPLLLRVEEFTLRITYAMVVLIGLIFLIVLARGDELSSVFLLGVALAVSAIPEGLPAAITVALAIGMRRMAKVNVIIRKLVAVEALGSCTLIASDKTGTLTVNELTVRRIVLPDGSAAQVGGEGLELSGEIQPSAADNLAQRQALILAGALANEATFEQRDGRWVGNGDAVDLAFLVLAHKAGLNGTLQRQHPGLGFIPYESEQAFCASCNRVDGSPTLLVKGSLETVLPMCRQASTGGALDHASIQQQMETMARDGFRVLALAQRTLSTEPSELAEEMVGMTFLGLVGMIDPLRPDVKEAIEQCRKAQIEVAMITGDHPQTALAIANELGMDTGGRAVTGSELSAAEQQGAEVFAALVAGSTLFARVEPGQKRQIVEQLIHAGHFVAVTGDGVNDAPALTHANVGIAMGKNGTDVARESADLILTDDHFASIVNGVREGRIVYNNIRKVIFLLISTGAAEIILFLLSLIAGLPLPLFPLQLLWLNLVTNGIQDVALAFEPAEGGELERPPRPPGEPIFDRLMIEKVVVNALVMGSVAFTIFAISLQQMPEQEARNLTLLLMVLFENVHALNSRSERRSLFRMPILGNPLLLLGIVIAQTIHIGAMYLPGLREVLEVNPVSIQQWAELLGIALILLMVNELHKFWCRKQSTGSPRRAISG